MRIANLDHRLVLLAADGCIDVATASQGRFSADPQAVYADWDAFTTWAAAVDPGSAQPYDAAQLGAPTPAPGQIFAIGLNYADHAGESGFTAPAEPAVFTKFVSSITGPHTTVALPAFDSRLGSRAGRRDRPAGTASTRAEPGTTLPG